MKKAILVALVLSATMALAQAPAAQQPAQKSFQSNLVERAQAPSYSDLYCSGFITNQHLDTAKLVSGGVASPDETLYAKGNQVFLTGGGYQEGSQYTVLRELKDPNHYEPFSGQKAMIASLGQPYAEIGRVRVTAIRGGTAVADVEFTCQNITIGDFVIPFQEHAEVSFRKTAAMERFPSNPGRVTGRIVMAREFDTVVATGQKVYIDAGSNKGIKAGDYFRAVRGYDPAKMDPVDAISYKAPVGDDTQKVPGTMDPAKAKDLPARNLGEMIVISVTPTSSTAMITNALEGIQVGDRVELEEPQQ